MAKVVTGCAPAKAVSNFPRAGRAPAVRPANGCRSTGAPLQLLGAAPALAVCFADGCRLRRGAGGSVLALRGLPRKRSDRRRGLRPSAPLRPLTLTSHGGDLASAIYMSHGSTTPGIPRRVVPSRTCCLKMGHIVRWICLSVNTFRRPWSDQSWSNTASSLTAKARMKTEV